MPPKYDEVGKVLSDLYALWFDGGRGQRFALSPEDDSRQGLVTVGGSEPRPKNQDPAGSGSFPPATAIRPSRQCLAMRVPGSLEPGAGKSASRCGLRFRFRIDEGTRRTAPTPTEGSLRGKDVSRFGLRYRISENLATLVSIYESSRGSKASLCPVKRGSGPGRASPKRR